MKTLATFLAACILLVSASAQADEFKPLGPVHLGAVAGVGVPSPISAQAVFKYKKLVGANLELGMLPEISVPIGDDTRIHQEMIDASVHLYPFQGAFFIGCGVGAQRMTVTVNQTQNVRGFDITGDARVQTNTIFLSPRLGFLHRFDFGLAIGMDIGVEIPVSGSTESSVSVDTKLPPGVNVPPVPQDAIDVANKVRTTPIPIIHLLQLGYIF